MLCDDEHRLATRRAVRYMRPAGRSGTSDRGGPHSEGECGNSESGRRVGPLGRLGRHRDRGRERD